MELKKLGMVGTSFLLGVAMLAQPAAALAAEYNLNNSVKAYYTSSNAKKGVKSTATYKAGKYFIYKKANGMYNISRKANVAGGWINPKDNKAKVTKPVVKPVEKAPVKETKVETKEEVKPVIEKVTKDIKAVGVKNNDGTYSLNVKTYGYINANDAKNQRNSRNVRQPGKYFIFREYNGMINISKTKGSAGSWINPQTKGEVTPTIPQTNNEKKVTETNTNKAISSRAPKLYSLNTFTWRGVINWGGYKYTWYSQRVLPGGGLKIPGRHVNKDGYVADKDGYIVLASNKPKGTILPTPFGYLGKVYDRGTYGNHLDVYVK